MLSIINKRSLGALNHNNTLKKLNKHIQKTRDIKLFIEFLKQGHYDIQVLANNQKNYIITDTHYSIKIKFINHIEQTVKTIYDIDLLRIEYNDYYFINYDLQPVWNELKIKMDSPTITKESFYPIINENFIITCFEETDDSLKNFIAFISKYRIFFEIAVPYFLCIFVYLFTLF